MNWPFLTTQINFLKGLLDRGNTYSMKRWNAMKIWDIMLMLTIADAIYHKNLDIDKLIVWVGAALSLQGITTLDKRIDARKEIEMEKAKKDLDLNVKLETKETKNEN